MHLLTWFVILAVSICYISQAQAGDCTYKKIYKEDDDVEFKGKCGTCKCSKKGKCKVSKLSEKNCNVVPDYENPVLDETKLNETESPGNETSAVGRLGYIIGCGYEVWTLTDTAPWADTNDIFRIRFFTRYWSVPYTLNNPGNDRERGRWDYYGLFPPNDHHVINYIKIEHAWGTNGWKIKIIFVKHTCTNRIYEFCCRVDCWVDRPSIPYIYIKRSNGNISP
ncbi:unnamed protein product [Owenia fusiformis]|uniref:Uncharacterized protein n=1 Tax=Owenia fusiformis TaxID=6347 RepID=A0A8J1THG3_OWEFU|nr:unnamed protein product [Owenia fusiformis]